MKKKGNIQKLKQFYNFLQKDTWQSFIVTMILAFIIIKFIFFPTLSLITGTQLPLVIVESCSMYHHEPGFEKTFESPIYKDNKITLEDTKSWQFPNGFNKGDVMFIVGVEEPEIGDVIIFNSGATGVAHPIIHRVIKAEDTYGTKGDNYKKNPNQWDYEKNIHEDQLVGKALFKIPAIGWLKLIFFEPGRRESQKGLCR